MQLITAPRLSTSSSSIPPSQDFSSVRRILSACIGKDDFICELASAIDPLATNERFCVLENVLQYNLGDALELAGRLNLSNKDLIGILTSRQMKELHPEFEATFQKELIKIARSLSNTSKQLIGQASNPFESAIRSDHSDLMQHFVAQHYESLYEDKTFSTLATSKLEPDLISYLHWMNRAVVPHFYTGPIVHKIKSILGTTDSEVLRADLKRAKFPAEELLCAQSIPLSKIERLGRIYGFQSEDFTTNLNRHSPLGIVYSSQRQLLKERITEQLLSSVGSRLGVESSRVSLTERFEPTLDGRKIPRENAARPQVRQVIEGFEKSSLVIPKGATLVLWGLSQDGSSVVAVYNDNGRFFVDDGNVKTLLPQEVKKVNRFEVGNSCLIVCESRQNKSFILSLPINLPATFTIKEKEYEGAVDRLYDEVEQILEVDGKWACKTKSGNKYCVIYDGQKSDDYNDVGTLCEFNRKLVYIAKIGRQYSVVSDGTPGATYDGIGHVVVVGGKLAYDVRVGKRESVVFDGNIGPWYDRVVYIENINGRLTYKAEIGNQSCYVHDGKQLALYDSVRSISTVNGVLTYVAKIGGKECVIYNEQKEPFYPEVSEILDLDGKLLSRKEKRVRPTKKSLLLVCLAESYSL